MCYLYTTHLALQFILKTSDAIDKEFETGAS